MCQIFREVLSTFFANYWQEQLEAWAKLEARMALADFTTKH
jgi:hypothetical protein